LLGLLLSSGGTGEADTITQVCNNLGLKVVPGGIQASFQRQNNAWKSMSSSDRTVVGRITPIDKLAHIYNTILDANMHMRRHAATAADVRSNEIDSRARILKATAIAQGLHNRIRNKTAMNKLWYLGSRRV
jgi:hypothetical protein